MCLLILMTKNVSLQVLSISTGEILAGGDICVPLPNSFLGWRVTAVQIWDDMIATVMKRFDIQQSEEVILFIGWKDGIVRAVCHFLPDFVPLITVILSLATKSLYSSLKSSLFIKVKVPPRPSVLRQ